MLSLVLIGVMFASTASARAQQLDTVVASGTTDPLDSYQHYSPNVNVSSSPQGQNLAGSATLGWNDGSVYGQVTCLKVTGPDHGAGKLGAPTTAIISIHGYLAAYGGPIYGDYEVQMIDNGGNGRDVIGVSFASYGDCSGNGVTFDSTTLHFGRAVVNDASTPVGFTTNPSPATVKTPVTFDGSPSPCAAAPCTDAWTDGTAKLGSGVKLTYTFYYVGTKHVLLTVTDARGAKSSVGHDLQVYARTFTTAGFANPSSWGVNTTVTFDASSSTCAVAPCTYTWSDATGAKLGTGTPLLFTYEYVGIKQVVLTMTDAHGTKSIVSHTLTIH